MDELLKYVVIFLFVVAFFFSLFFFSFGLNMLVAAIVFAFFLLFLKKGF